MFFPRPCIKYQAIQRKHYFDTIFLFHKRIIMFIGNLKQPKISERNTTKSVVLVIFIHVAKVKVSGQNQRSMLRSLQFESKVKISHPENIMKYISQIGEKNEQFGGKHMIS